MSRSSSIDMIQTMDDTDVSSVIDNVLRGAEHYENAPQMQMPQQQFVQQPQMQMPPQQQFVQQSQMQMPPPQQIYQEPQMQMPHHPQQPQMYQEPTKPFISLEGFFTDEIKGFVLVTIGFILLNTNLLKDMLSKYIKFIVDEEGYHNFYSTILRAIVLGLTFIFYSYFF